MENIDWRRLKRTALIKVAQAGRELQDEFEDGDRAAVRLPDLLQRAALKGVTIVPNIGIKDDDTEIAVKGLSYVVEAECKKHRIYGSHIGLTWDKLASWGVKFDDGDIDGIQAFLDGIDMDEATYKALPISPKDAEFEGKVAARFVDRVKQFGWIEILPKLSNDPEAVEIGFSMWSPNGNHRLYAKDKDSRVTIDHRQGLAKAMALANMPNKTEFRARASKIYYNDGTGIRKIQSSGYHHEAFEFACKGGLKELSLTTRALNELPHWHIARGALVNSGKRPRKEGWFRRHSNDDPTTNDVVVKARSWVALDVDDLPTIDGGRFLDNPTKHIRDLLDTYGPEQLHGAGCTYKFSQSCGVVEKDGDRIVSDGGDDVNTHLFLLLDKPIADDVLKAWLMNANARARLEHGLTKDPFDVHVLVTSQPIFTGKPMLVNVESSLPKLGLKRCGVVEGDFEIVSTLGIDVETIAKEHAELELALHKAGLKPPEGFRKAISEARTADHQLKHGVAPSQALVPNGNWKGGAQTLDDFENKLRASISDAAVHAPLTSATGSFIRANRCQVDVEGMADRIVSAGIAMAGSYERAVARNQILSHGNALGLVQNLLTGQLKSASEFPAVVDPMNALIETPALNDEVEDAIIALRSEMARLGNPAQVELGDRWRIERNLAKSLCIDFTVSAAARALASEAGIPPRDATSLCVKAVLTPEYSDIQWRMLKNYEREGEDTSKLIPQTAVQNARLNKLAARIESGMDMGFILQRNVNGFSAVVGVEYEGKILSSRMPPKNNFGNWDAFTASHSAGAPIILHQTNRAQASAGLWGSPAADAEPTCTLRIFSLPSEAAEWMEKHGTPSDTRAIAFGGHTDREAREALAEICSNLVSKGAIGVVMHSATMAAQDIADELRDKGVPVAAPKIMGFPATLGEALEPMVAPVPEAEPEEIDEIGNMFGELDSQLKTFGQHIQSAPKGIPMRQ